MALPPQAKQTLRAFELYFTVISSSSFFLRSAMEFSKRMLPALLFFVFLLLASGICSEMMAEAVRPAGFPNIGEEKRTCESQSHRFKGLCFSANNCGHVCRTEGFHFGKCRGIRRRCFCTKNC